MDHLDLQVINQALDWAKGHKSFWLCTVLASYGSSPREPGSWLVADEEGRNVGSLSGGCVEEDFLARIREGAFKEGVSRIRYGAPDGPANAQVQLPCGGILDVLVEKFPTGQATIEHLQRLKQALTGSTPIAREVSLTSGEWGVFEDDGLGARVEEIPDRDSFLLRVGPVARLVIAGISSVSEACAEFARTLGFEVIVCDPRDEQVQTFSVPNVHVMPILPSLYITQEGCHSATAVVALAHDPRIDDLALVEAVKTEAFYIGVMGSERTSQNRAVRLLRSGGLSQREIDGLHMPIGLALGSKTPAEIALAVMADILRVRRKKERHQL